MIYKIGAEVNLCYTNFVLTILLTTKNNPDLVERQLEYYYQNKLLHKILISDASDKIHHKKNLASIEYYKKKKINIEYYWQAGFSVKESHLFLISKINTEFSVCVADGALLVPECLESCINFLKKNKDYIAAQGKVYSFKLKNNNKIYGQLESFHRIKTNLSYDSDPVKRLEYTSKNYCNCLYSVMYSSVWKEIWSESEKVEFHWVSSEVLPALLLVLNGKIGELNKTYLFRHVHNKRTIKDDYSKSNNEITVDMIRWSGSIDDWNNFLKNFKNILFNKLNHYIKISNDNYLRKKLETICQDLFFSNIKEIKINNINFFEYLSRIYIALNNLIFNVIDNDKKNLINFLLNQNKSSK